MMQAPVGWASLGSRLRAERRFLFVQTIRRSVMKTRSINRLNHASAALVLGLLAGFTQSANAQYTFQSIDVPAEWGSFTSVYGINNAGALVGNYATFDWVGEGFIFT